MKHNTYGVIRRRRKAVFIVVIWHTSVTDSIVLKRRLVSPITQRQNKVAICTYILRHRCYFICWRRNM